MKIIDGILGAAWLESTDQPADEKRFSISEVSVNEMRLLLGVCDTISSPFFPLQ